MEEHNTTIVILPLLPRGVALELTYAFIQVTALCHGDKFLDSMNVDCVLSTKPSCS